jgi:hypothetical protein
VFRRVALSSLLLLPLAATAMACSSSNRRATQTVSPESPTPTPTALPATSATTAASPKPTGIASVDAVIASAAAHDLQSLERLIRYTKQPCVTPHASDGIETRPPCNAGESPGQLVDAFFTPSCEPVFVRGTEMARKSVEHEFGLVSRFFAATGAGTAPVGKYFVVFATEMPHLAVVALVDEDGILGVGNYCGVTAQQFFGMSTPIVASSTW